MNKKIWNILAVIAVLALLVPPGSQVYPPARVADGGQPDGGGGWGQPGDCRAADADRHRRAGGFAGAAILSVYQPESGALMAVVEAPFALGGKSSMFVSVFLDTFGMPPGDYTAVIEVLGGGVTYGVIREPFRLRRVDVYLPLALRQSP